MTHTLAIDLETYSSVPIGDAGSYAYSRSDDFEILLFGYSLDGNTVQVIDVAQGEEIPQAIIDMLTDENVIKTAYNAAFEWGCLRKHTGKFLPPSQWRDTMLAGLYAGYTAGLDATGKALGLPEYKQKLATGKALIRYFCIPCAPTKSNGGRTRNLPKHDPDKWKLFKEYNAQDVVTEMEIKKYLSCYPVPDFVQKQWETDLIINNRGVAVDMDFVNGALEIGAEVRQQLTAEAVGISGLKNPNSIQQLSAWLSKETGEEVTDVRKDTVVKMLKNENSGTVQRMLEIRQELGKTSTKKYDAIEKAVCSDDRVRGLLQFYGANRTGRWAGRLVQVQNLPRTYTEPLELARELVKARKLDALRLMYGSPNDTLSQLIRTAFIAAPGNVLIDADFSAIEARVISWLAGEEWRLDVFRNGGDIYCASASQMFGVPVVKGGVNGHLRQKGKVAELALGYQGSTGALIAMGAIDMGLKKEELPEIVNKWRTANPSICNLWWAMDRAATDVVEGKVAIARVRELTLRMECDVVRAQKSLAITLPSGRKLFYVDPVIEYSSQGKSSISYMGMDQTTKKWKRVETYGGKLIENCVQAIARDCLAQAIEHLEAAGLPVVFHVHDEAVIDVKPFGTDDEMLDKVVQIMSAPIDWAKGLPLNADGWVGTFFKKD